MGFNQFVLKFLKDYLKDNGATWDNKLVDEAMEKYPKYARDRSVKNILSHHKSTFKVVEESKIYDTRTGQRNRKWGLVS